MNSASIADATWECLGARPGGTVISLSRLPDGRLVAGAGAGVHLSDDGGGTWRRWGSGAPLPSIGGLAWADGALYAASAAGCFRSLSPDRPWEMLLRGPVTSVAAAPGGFVLVGTPDDGVTRTLDGGRTWLAAGAGLRSLRINGLAVAGLGPSLSALVATDDGVYRTSGEMRAWRRVLPSVSGVSDIAVQDDGSTTLWLAASSDGAVHQSRDGVGWTHVPVGTVDALAFSDHHDWIVAVSDGTLLESHDAGATWTRFAHVDDVVLSVQPVPGDGGVILGLAHEGIARWRAVHGLDRPALTARLVGNACFVASESPEDREQVWTLITVGIDDGVAVSNDGGTWSESVPSGPDPVVAIDAAALSGVAVVVLGDGGLRRRERDGSWVAVPIPDNVHPVAVAVRDHPGGDLAMISTDGALWMCSAQRWVEVMRVAGSGRIVAAHLDEHRPDHVVAVTMGIDATGGEVGIVWASQNGGDDWRTVLERRDPPNGAALIDTVDDNIVVAWGSTLFLSAWPSGGHNPPTPLLSSLTLAAVDTITSLGRVASEDHAGYVLGTNRGVAMIGLHASGPRLLEFDESAPAPILSIAWSDGDPDRGSLWAIDIHGQAWRRRRRDRSWTGLRTLDTVPSPYQPLKETR